MTMNIIELLEKEYLNRYVKKKFLILRAILLYYRDPNFRVVVLIQYASKGQSLRMRQWCCKKLSVKYGVFMSKNAQIGKKLKVEHFNGLVIGSGAIIGDNCTLYQQVTIGQKDNEYPIIGNNVVVYAGAKMVGRIKVGDNATIGANAVVIHDVPEYGVAVGVPARVIKGRGE